MLKIKKMPQNKDLEELTEVDFERGIIKIMRELSSQQQTAVNMINDIDYYKNKEYKIHYYFNKKEMTYTYFAEKRKMGFNYENNKTSKEQSTQAKQK